MKKIIFIAQFFLAAIASVAAPLSKDYVSKDAKWMVHIDVEQLLESKFGDLALAQAQKSLDEEMDSAMSINVEMLASEIHSITAYGSTFDEQAAENSVVVVKTGDKAQAIIDGYVATLEDGEENPVTILEDKEYPSYLIDNEVNVAFPEPTIMVVSKSYNTIERTADLLNGKGETISESEAFSNMDNGDGFFLVSVLQNFADLEKFPPQARVLKKAKAGAFYAGEAGDDFQVKLILSTEDEKVSEQLYRIVLGMLALVSFAEFEDQSLSVLTDGADIQKGSDFVSIHLKYPSEEILRLVTTSVEGKDGQTHSDAD